MILAGMITPRRALGSGPRPTQQTPAPRSRAATAAERSTEVAPLEEEREPAPPASGRRPLNAGPEGERGAP